MGASAGRAWTWSGSGPLRQAEGSSFGDWGRKISECHILWHPTDFEFELQASQSARTVRRTGDHISSTSPITYPSL
eukprot:2580743-Pyramimonas_sp.AAC.1